MSDDPPKVAASFSYPTQSVDVLGSRIAYIEQGSGEPIVFVHGNPTWSYLWRNVMPHLAPHARCIAVDLIGMGRSDKPDIAYRFFDHYRYFEAFMDALGLDRVTLVGHDWGGSLAFNYLRHHPDRVRGLAGMEVMLYPLTWTDFPAQFRLGFRLMRTPVIGWLMLSVANLFVEMVLPMGTRRYLGQREKRYYREPYPTSASRRAVRQWPCEIPLDGRPADVHAAFEAITAALAASDRPKLLLYGEPGALIERTALEWARAHLPALETGGIGRGIHYLQEDQPDAIGRALAEWYQRAVVGVLDSGQGRR
jgi:haloalkane dehalogenase